MAPRPIMHIIAELETGGAEMMLLRLLDATDRHRWQPSVLTLRGRGMHGTRVEELGLRLAALGVRGRLPGVRAAWRLRREIRVTAPRLIQGWMYHGNVAALVGAGMAARRVPVMWSIRNTVFDFASHNRWTAGLVRLGALLSSRAARIIYNSRTSAAQHAELGFASAHAVVIPNGFDTDSLVPSQRARHAFRLRLGVADDAILIGRVGRYDPLKDYPGFLQAAAAIWRARPQARFVLAGRGVDNANAELARIVETSGLGGTVQLLGEVMPVNDLMASLDIACSSSQSEGFPNVLAEAMACGVPCVATDVGDSAWILGSGGVVVPQGDSAALAAACCELIDAGVEARRSIGAQGRARVIHYFSLRNVVSDYEALCDEVLVSEAGR